MRLKIEEKIINITAQNANNYEISSVYCIAQKFFDHFLGWNVCGISAKDGLHIDLGTFKEHQFAEMVCQEIEARQKKGETIYQIPKDIRNNVRSEQNEYLSKID